MWQYLSRFILIDEGDFFRKGEQEDVRHVSERHIAKSNPYIVMVSTPNAPEGLFERIEKEAEDTCLYTKEYSLIILIVLVRYTLLKR
jgi:hypothetical protein